MSLKKKPFDFSTLFTTISTTSSIERFTSLSHWTYFFYKNKNWKYTLFVYVMKNLTLWITTYPIHNKYTEADIIKMLGLFWIDKIFWSVDILADSRYPNWTSLFDIAV